MSYSLSLILYNFVVSCCKSITFFLYLIDDVLYVNSFVVALYTTTGVDTAIPLTGAIYVALALAPVTTLPKALITTVLAAWLVFPALVPIAIELIPWLVLPAAKPIAIAPEPCCELPALTPIASAFMPCPVVP